MIGHFALAAYGVAACGYFLFALIDDGATEQQASQICETGVRNTRRLAALCVASVVAYNGVMLTIDGNASELARISHRDETLVGAHAAWIGGQFAATGCFTYGMALAGTYWAFYVNAFETPLRRVQLTGLWLTLSYAALHAAYQMSHQTQRAASRRRRFKKRARTTKVVAYRLL